LTKNKKQCKKENNYNISTFIEEVTMPSKMKAKKKIRCAGKTAEDKRCKRMVELPAKYCYLHKQK